MKTILTVFVLAVLLFTACSPQPIQEQAKLPPIQNTTPPTLTEETPAPAPISESKPSPPPVDLTFEQIKAQALEPTYENFYRNNDNYKGKIVHLKGKVTQIIGGDLRIATTYPEFESEFGSYEDEFYLYNPDSLGGYAKEHDFVNVYGESVGLITYRTVMGASVTVPAVNALSLQIK